MGKINHLPDFLVYISVVISWSKVHISGNYVKYLVKIYLALMIFESDCFQIRLSFSDISG
jgi:hypothetical protein